MDLIEEGDLMDRVPILLTRDKQYYQQHQTVLQESICPGIVGGKLDFPRSASFAAVKIVKWWEDEFVAAYRCHSGLLHLDELDDDDDGGVEAPTSSTSRPTTAAADGPPNLTTQRTASPTAILKTSNPEQFVGYITKSSDRLLEHLHSMSQEALDHADLTVLTATIGAAALIKNTLWVYLNSTATHLCPPRGDDPGGSLRLSHRQFAELTEALAERLLDLHCRLLSLYIVQDADCLHWEAAQPFFESGRGSYTVQMWWLYMLGTKESLWNSVPPAMAQRVLAGMLNETLSILTVRYTQTAPSVARTPLLLTDVCNLLFCCAELLAAVADGGEAYVGRQSAVAPARSKIVRDVHAKCEELFACLLLRGAPLGTLYKCMQRRPIGLYGTRAGRPAAWLQFAMPRYFGATEASAATTATGNWAEPQGDPAPAAIAFHLKILLQSPQASWSLLVRVLLMRDARLAGLIMAHLCGHQPAADAVVPTLDQPLMRRRRAADKCAGFLCGKECNKLAEWVRRQADPVGQANYQTVLALCYVVVLTGRQSDVRGTLIAVLERLGGDAEDGASSSSAWSGCLDRRQVWNQKRPAWMEAILYLVYPVLDAVVQMLVQAVLGGGGATMYQAMALALSCLTEMWDCIPDCVYTVSVALGELVPAECRPLGGAVLVQVLFAALYTKLLEAVRVAEVEERDAEQAIDGHSRSSVCLALAEAICSIDEDNKHTEAIERLCRVAAESRTGGDARSEEETNGEDDDGGDGGDDSDAYGSVDRRAAAAAVAVEYTVEAADYVGELLASDVLATVVGKQCLKILYAYARCNGEWLLQQLGVAGEVPPSRLQPLAGQSSAEPRLELLAQMFHVGGRPFDQLLTRALRVEWAQWLQRPLQLTAERAWLQIGRRPEFAHGARLSVEETVMVAAVRAKCKP